MSTHRTCILTEENMHTAEDCTLHDHEEDAKPVEVTATDPKPMETLANVTSVGISTPVISHDNYKNGTLIWSNSGRRIVTMKIEPPAGRPDCLTHPASAICLNGTWYVRACREQSQFLDENFRSGASAMFRSGDSNFNQLMSLPPA